MRHPFVLREGCISTIPPMMAQMMCSPFFLSSFARFFPNLGPSIGSPLVNTSSDDSFSAAFRPVHHLPPPSSATTFFVSHLFLLPPPPPPPPSALSLASSPTRTYDSGTCVISHYVRPRVGPRIYGLCIRTYALFPVRIQGESYRKYFLNLRRF